MGRFAIRNTYFGQQSMKKFASAVAMLTLSSIFWFAVFEYSARYWVRGFGDPLDRARLVMEPSDRYLWRMRPLFSGKFENANLTTDANGFRIDDEAETKADAQADVEKAEQPQMIDWIVLGPSSAFGWGVEYHETYASVAAKSLGKGLKNASQVGYGISQGLRVYEDHRESWKLNPKTVFIAYGVNDVDRFRFFGPIGITDEDVFARPDISEQLRLEKWIYRFAFSGLVMRAMQEGAMKYGCPGKNRFEIRESEEGFIASLKNLTEKVVADGHKPVIIDSPFLYPFKTDPLLAELATKQFAVAHEAANSGKCDEAKRQFQLARANEPHRVAQAIAKLNIRLKDFAESNMFRFIEASKMVGTADDFVDPIHFSVKGNRQIAEGVARELDR